MQAAENAMKRCFKGLTDTGVVRNVNQDHYSVDPEGRFFIVADGMGGHAGGEEASQIATEVITDYLNQQWNSDYSSENLLIAALEKANEAILADQQTHPERADMGTTVVAVLFRQQQPWYGHIGDSRLYQLRGKKLRQITEDHTWVAKALKAGDITTEQAKSHPWRHVLSQCLGRKEIEKIEVKTLDVQLGDRLLLCSDGLTEEVSDENIAHYLHESATCEDAAKGLVELAKKNGGSDNITVVIIEE